MISNVETLVGRINYDGVFRQPQFYKLLLETVDTFVHAFTHLR